MRILSLLKPLLLFIIIFQCKLVLCLGEDFNTTTTLRVVSLSPNLTSIITELGCEKNLVGITRFCKINQRKNPPEIIGDYLSPNLEKIVSLKPDVVFLLKSQKQIEEKISKFGIRTISVGNDTIAEIRESILKIGDELKKQGDAKTIVNKIDESIKKNKKVVNKRVRVVFVVGRERDDLTQIYVAGKGTFIDEIIEAGGGENIIQTSFTAYPIISKEVLLKLNPDVILDSSAEASLTEQEIERQLNIWRKLSTLKAVREKKIYIITDPQITIPGPHIPESIEKVAQLLSGRKTDGKK